MLNKSIPSAFALYPSAGNSNKLRKIIISALSILIAGCFLYLALQNLNWNSFWKILRSGDYKIIAFLLPISSFNYLLRALRWRILIQSEGKISAISVFWTNMVGYMGNAYLPARAGEIVRSVFLGKQSGAGTSFILATALTERMLDAFALVLIGSAALLFQINTTGFLLTAVRTMAITSTVGLLTVLLIPFFELRLTRFMRFIPLPAIVCEKCIEQLQRFLLGMRSLKSINRFLYFMLFTAIVWLIDGLGTMIGVRIIGQSLNLGQSLILLSALGLSSAIPSTPGYVGVYQFVAVTVLVPFGFTKPDAIAYILISQVLGYFVVTFWGLIGLSRIKSAAL